MASKLLDRLRRTLFKEGEVRADEADDFPESSELEDDTDYVSARLGGTLRFDGDVVDSEDTGEASGPDSDSDCFGESLDNACSSTDISPTGPSLKGSDMFSRQLPESWRNLHTCCISEKLIFEVTDASVVQEATSKYVLYTIHVIQSGTLDKTPAVITRRYTDFERLHGCLRRRYSEAMEGVFFPRKKLRRNFAAETIAKRSRAFEQYLGHLHSLAELRAAPAFLEFFYMGDLRASQVLLRVGRYQEATGLLLNVLRLLERLGCAPPPAGLHRPLQRAHWVFVLSALACCLQELERPAEAQEHCESALREVAPAREALRQQRPPRLHPLLVPLLQVNVRLSWKIAKDKRRWEALLQDIQELGMDVSGQPGLKEWLIREILVESEGETKLKGKGEEVT
ncbi:sorting nexin-21 [Brachyhypopomus gauderio]|uniref:sorting nexin-21 n=1 Tax=Brachyhypopomus gauderio TaxID=698409 RepID=UPI00404202DE